MNQPHIDEAVVTEVLSHHVDEIRAKAREDHADELQQAGHTDAADYLRTNR